MFCLKISTAIHKEFFLCREILQLMSTFPIKEVDFEDILEPKVRAYYIGRNCYDLRATSSMMASRLKAPSHLPSSYFAPGKMLRQMRQRKMVWDAGSTRHKEPSPDDDSCCSLYSGRQVEFFLWTINITRTEQKHLMLSIFFIGFGTHQ